MLGFIFDLVMELVLAALVGSEGSKNAWWNW